MREDHAVAAKIPDSVEIRELVTFFPILRYSDESAATDVAEWMEGAYRESYPPEQLEYFISQNVRDVCMTGFPKPASRDRIVWVMKYYEALTAVDDAANSRWCMTEPEALAMMDELGLAIHDRPVEFGSDIARHMAEVIAAMRAGMSEGLSRRFVETFQVYLDRMRSELVDPGNNAAELATVDDFLKFRYENYSGPCILTQLEYVINVDLTAELANVPEVEEIGRKAIYHSQIINDLTSFGRESNHGEHSNIAYFLLLKSDLGLQEAFDRLCKLAEAYDADFLRLRKKILSGPLAFNAGVLAYLEALEYMISGFDMWHFMTNRFRYPEYEWDGNAFGEFNTEDKPENYAPRIG